MKRLECLDGLRGVLAMYVTVGHMAPFALLPAWLLSAVGHGGAAVDVFFILSGLVISQSLDRLQGDRRRFLLARVLRIYPVFLPVFAFAILVQPLPCGFDQMPWIGAANPARDICSARWPADWATQIAAHLVMAHGLFPNAIQPDIWVSFLGAAWSLSTEWQFYVVAALMWRFGETRLLMLLLSLAVLGLAWQATAAEPWQFSRAFLPGKAHFFALGVVSRGVVRKERWAWARYCVVAAIALAICGVHGNAGKLLPPLIWSLCLAAQLWPWLPGLGLPHRLLRSRTALWFGALSYPIYLVNEPIHKAIAPLISHFAAGDGALFSTVWIPAAVLLPVLASAWLHKHIEAPAMRLRRTIPAVARQPAAAPPRQAPVAPGIAAIRHPVTVQEDGRGL
jgi:peptidoglycan/LPS O-acetylase OafA/YrhL